MANGAPPPNRQLPPDVREQLAREQLVEMAKHETAARLQATLTDPTVDHRVGLCLPAVAQENEQALLIFALASGERWTFQISDRARQRIGLQLLEDLPREIRDQLARKLLEGDEEDEAERMVAKLPNGAVELG